MTRSGKYRSLASLALLRLNESDLRSLHATISEMSPGSFMELIRDIEDEVDNSMALSLDRSNERSTMSSGTARLYEELNMLRLKELRIPVQRFVDLLSESLSHIAQEDGVEIPRFDSRRGLQAWIGKLVQIFSEQNVHHAAMRIRHERSDSKGSDWKLR